MTGEQDDQAPPEGWTRMDFKQGFAARSGSYYRPQSGAPMIAMRVTPAHINLDGVAHGGALMTLADMALFRIAMHDQPKFRAVTVNLYTEFLSAGEVGAFLIAGGEVTRRGRSLVFARGLIRAGDRSVATFTGAIKRIG